MARGGPHLSVFFELKGQVGAVNPKDSSTLREERGYAEAADRKTMRKERRNVQSRQTQSGSFGCADRKRAVCTFRLVGDCILHVFWTTTENGGNSTCRICISVYYTGRLDRGGHEFGKRSHPRGNQNSAPDAQRENTLGSDCCQNYLAAARQKQRVAGSEPLL